MKLKTGWLIGGFVVLVMGLVAFFAVLQNQSGKLDNFAKCLKEKQAVFYGAFWCPHCQRQKALFGNSEQYLPYVECSTTDGKAQTKACIDKKIEGYPTWEFKDGTRLSGEITLEKLAEKTTCKLP